MCTVDNKTTSETIFQNYSSNSNTCWYIHMHQSWGLEV